MKQFFAPLLQFIVATTVTAAELPQDYVVQENSGSPNGKYALVVRSRQSAIDSEVYAENQIYLGQIAEHRVLGAITGVDYFEGQNHRDLADYWAADSSWCVVRSDAPFWLRDHLDPGNPRRSLRAK